MCAKPQKNKTRRAGTSGGPATATGIDYQALAIALALLDVYQGTADWVRAEVPPMAMLGDVELTPISVDDFVVRRSGEFHYHQAKSTAPGGGTWTVSSLTSAGILSAFQQQNKSTPNSHLYLTTASDCPLFSRVAKQVQQQSLAELKVNWSKGDEELFKEACGSLGIPEEDLFVLLQHCHLEQSSGASLTRHFNQLAVALFADPRRGMDAICKLAHDMMCTQKEIRGTELKDFMTKAGVAGRPPADLEDITEAIRSASASLRECRKSVAGICLPRPVVGEIVDWVKAVGPDNCVCGVLLDEAGSGKSATLSMVQEALEKDGWLVLAIKADRLPAFSTLDELSNCLQLPPNIPGLLQSLQMGGDRLAVLIDQVDTLSSAMGRRGTELQVSLDLVDRLRCIPGLPILVACRQFDWKYDPRLSQIEHKHLKEFRLGRLRDSEVNIIFAHFGMKPDKVRPLTRSILTLPIHLELFSQVVEAEMKTGTPPNLAVQQFTPLKLYQDYWEMKQRKAHVLTTPIDLHPAIDCMCTYMASNETFTIPTHAVPLHLHSSADWLTTEGMLEKDRFGYRFFHQSFFDFMGAVQFAKKGISLEQFLLQHDQGLFFRPLVKQVLEYLRAADNPKYLKELTGLLTNAQVRRHLKTMALAWLGQLQDPTPSELTIVEPFLNTVIGRNQSLGHFAGNGNWFDLFGLERIGGWYQAPPSAPPNNLLWYLGRCITVRPKEVVQFLANCVHDHTNWEFEWAYCLFFLDKQWTEETIQTLRSLIPHWGKGRPYHAGDYFWSAMGNLADAVPETACQFLAEFLMEYHTDWQQIRTDPSQAHAMIYGDGGILPDHQNYSFWHAMEGCSKKSPMEWLTFVSPQLILLLESTCHDAHGSYLHDQFLWRLDDVSMERQTRQFLAALADSLQAVSRIDPDFFCDWVKANSSSKYFPIQMAICCGLTTLPPSHCQHALAYLLEGPERLFVGRSPNGSDLSNDLLKRHLPNWTAEDVNRLRGAISSLRNQPDSNPGFERLIMRNELLLLSTIHNVHPLDWVAARMKEIQDQNPGIKPWSNVADQTDSISDVTSTRLIDGLTNEELLNRLRSQPSAAPSSLASAPSLHAIEALALELRALAQKEPSRFSEFVLSALLQSDRPEYAGAIIDGLIRAGVQDADLSKLLAKFGDTLADSPRLRIIHALSNRQTPVNGDLAEVLLQWALQISPANTNSKPIFSGRSQDLNVLLTNGMNSERGAALWAVCKSLWGPLKQDPGHLLKILEMFERDPDQGVRAVAIAFLPVGLQANSFHACKLFRTFVGNDSQLLSENACYQFMLRALKRNYKDVKWGIDLLLQSGDKVNRTHGAQLACIAAFDHPEADAEASQCESGEEAYRIGAATVYAANFSSAECYAKCKVRLRSYWNDESVEVQKRAAHFMHSFEGLRLESYKDDILDWSRTPAFQYELGCIVYRLHETPTADPALTLAIAKRILETVGTDIGDISTSAAAYPHQLVPAILAVYNASNDQAERSRVLDLLEELEPYATQEVQKAFEIADRI